MNLFIIILLISFALLYNIQEYNKCPYQFNQTLKEQLMDSYFNTEFFLIDDSIKNFYCKNIRFIYGIKESICKHNIINKDKGVPKISIIVPVYNVEKYLDQCINSLIFQTYKDIEIIFINDESNDNSGKILDFYSSIDNRITVIHQKNSEVSCSRNLGIDLAKGKYIHMIDSDDYVSIQTYQYVYKYFENKDIDIIEIGSEIFDSDNDVFDETNIETSDSDIIDFSDIPFLSRTSWSYIFKLSFIKQNQLKFIRNYDAGQDTTFNFIMAGGVKNYKKLSGRFYKYRKGITNQKTNQIKGKIREFGLPNRPGVINRIYFVKKEWKERGWLKNRGHIFLNLIGQFLNLPCLKENPTFTLESIGRDLLTEEIIRKVNTKVKNIINKLKLCRAKELYYIYISENEFLNGKNRE